MKAHLRGGKSRAADEILLGVLSDADRLEGVLGTIQGKIGEARVKADAIICEAELEASTRLENARKEATAIVAKAKTEASEVGEKTKLELRKVQKDRYDLMISSQYSQTSEIALMKRRICFARQQPRFSGSILTHKAQAEAIV